MSVRKMQKVKYVAVTGSHSDVAEELTSLERKDRLVYDDAGRPVMMPPVMVQHPACSVPHVCVFALVLDR